MSQRSGRVVVWVDAWQMACCGTPFAIGDSVSWSIRTDVDRAFLSVALSAETADRIGYREEHHDDLEEADLDFALDATGVVRALWVASCLYEFDSGEGVSTVVAGSGTLQAVVSTGDHLVLSEDRNAMGWVVEVDEFDAG